MKNSRESHFSKESQKSAQRIISLTGTWVHGDIAEFERNKNGTTTTMRKRVVEKLNKALGVKKDAKKSAKKNMPIKTRNLLDTVFIPPSDQLHGAHTYEMKLRCSSKQYQNTV